MSKPDRIRILELEVDPVTRGEFKDICRAWLHGDTPRHIATLNAEFAVNASRDEEFRNLLQKTDLNLTDGAGILWADRVAAGAVTKTPGLGLLAVVWASFVAGLHIIAGRGGIRLREKISGVDAVWLLSEIAAKENKSVFLLGGFGDTAQIAAKALRVKNPSLRVAGLFAGDPDSDEAFEKVSKAQPDVLFVAYGMRKQEKWIARNLQKLPVKLAVGLGGTFDYLAKKRLMAPSFLRAIGLEWAWRLLTQPWRAVRVFDAVCVFPWQVVRYRLQMLKPYRRNVAALIVRKDGKALICRRRAAQGSAWVADTVWQMPQGGLERHEAVEDGLWRELKEEVGIRTGTLLKLVPDAFHYDWPPEIAYESYGGIFRGQQQTLAVVQVPQDTEVTLDHKEFDDYRWVPAERLVDEVHPLRKKMARIAYEAMIK